MMCFGASSRRMWIFARQPVPSVSVADVAYFEWN